MATKKAEKGGVSRNRHTESVSDFRGRVKAFEREFTEEAARVKRTRKGASFDRWAVKKMATFAALAASVAQRRRTA